MLYKYYAKHERELIAHRIKAGFLRIRKQNKPIGKRSKDKKPRRKSGYHLRWAKKGVG